MAIAGVFPGQGSQSLKMLADLAQAHSLVRQTFEEASDAIDFNLWACVHQGEDEDLNLTENTQPAMLAADIAVWRVWQDQGGEEPVVLAGHSLGEYSALVAAGVLSFTDAAQVVRYRGQYMQQAVKEGTGAMAAILGLDDQIIVDICQNVAVGGIVQAVNFNAPGQVVIAGNTAAVEQAVMDLKAAGAKRALKLPVSVPSHCDLMRPAAEQLAEVLSQIEIGTPEIPVLHNVDASTRFDAEDIMQALIEQLYKPVRWVDTVQQFSAGFDAEHMIEFGPGKVLTGLSKRIDRSLKAVCVMDNDSLDKALALS